MPILAFFLMSQNVFAVSIQTAGFDLSYKAGPNSGYEWANSLVYGQTVNLQEASGYQFLTADLSPAGNYASIHFETNIVANASSQQYLNFKNLDFMSINACSSSVSGSLNIQASSVSTAVTPWTDNHNRPSKTLTVYGDVALGGLTPSTQQKIFCLVGSPSYPIFSTNYTSASANMYFEQNPMTILYTNNQSENLLQSQINQNNTIINQNQQILDSQNQNTGDIIDNQTQNTQDIIDNQTQNTEDIIRSNQNCRMSNNLVDIDDFSLHVTNNRTYSYTLPHELSAGTYTLSYKYFSNNNPSAKVNVIYSGSGGQYTLSLSNGGVNTFTAINSFNRLYFYIRSDSPADSSVSLSDIMLVSGSSSADFEPFGEEICKNYNAEFYDEQRQANDNISGQSSSDIDGAENQATTNLIGVLSGFISAFRNVNATNCNLTLEFPDYAGGSRVVNICSGKEKAPRIVEIGSSLLLIGVFVPLAYILIRMIYNEIRSWTNG